jgi:hypothetical protein
VIAAQSKADFPPGILSQRTRKVIYFRGRPEPYNVCMARGWESKSVENQQEEAHEESVQAAKSRKGVEKHSRERDLLQLARTSITQKLEAAENPRYREQLNQALADLDKQLKALDAKA